MIIPKEAPYKKRLHGYYLKFENFVAAMQEEIGSGCIYCKSRQQAHMIYFNPQELVRCVAEEQGQPPRIYHQLGDVIQAFKQHPFIVSVHYLDNRAIAFWGQLPPHHQIKDLDTNADGVSIDILAARYKADRFSGFLDISFVDGEGGLLFFLKGKMVGGSYSWGQGGLSPREKDYRRLAALFENQQGKLSIGTFISASR